MSPRNLYLPFCGFGNGKYSCMENNGTDETTLFKESCMLVSDSNEVSTQLDSLTLTYDELVALAQENLFKRHLDMSKYLTNSEF